MSAKTFAFVVLELRHSAGRHVDEIERGGTLVGGVGETVVPVAGYCCRKLFVALFIT